MLQKIKISMVVDVFTARGKRVRQGKGGARPQKKWQRRGWTTKATHKKSREGCLHLRGHLICRPWPRLQPPSIERERERESGIRTAATASVTLPSGWVRTAFPWYCCCAARRKLKRQVQPLGERLQRARSHGHGSQRVRMKIQQPQVPPVEGRQTLASQYRSRDQPAVRPAQNEGLLHINYRTQTYVHREKIYIYIFPRSKYFHENQTAQRHHSRYATRQYSHRAPNRPSTGVTAGRQTETCDPPTPTSSRG